MEQIIKSEVSIKHMAGIVPVASPPLDFKMPWNDAMMPIAPDYLAVERAVYECVLAGCNSIWIVCHVGTEPLLRQRIGDYVYNRIYNNRERESTICINVFYVPIHPKDRDKRDSLGYSILYGADSAFRVCCFLSKWVAPERYYCAFPFGISPPEFAKDNKSLILSSNKVFFAYNGKTVKDGIYASFTFDAEDYKKSRDIIKKYVMCNWKEDREPTKREKKTLHLGLEEIFKDLDTENRTMVEYPWFYNIGSWTEYCNFLSKNIVLERNKHMFSNHKRKDLNS